MSIKKVVSLCLAIVMLFSLIGCNFSYYDKTSSEATSSLNQHERVIEEATKYLEEKYPDDEFTYVSSNSHSWGTLYYDMNFESKKYDGQTFLIYADPRKDEIPDKVVTSYYKDENGNIIFDYYDTYYSCSMRADAEEYFGEKIKKNLGEDVLFKIEFDDDMYTAKKLAGNLYFQDYLDHCGFWLLCCSTVRFEDMEMDLKDLISDLKNSDIYANMVYACVKEESLETIQNESYKFIFENDESIFFERKEYYLYGDKEEYECDIIVY